MLTNEIIRLEITDSTNRYAAALISEKEINEGTIVLARCQSAGKGQKDNVWESEAGKNLTFSMILSPVFLPAEKQFYLNKIISLAIGDYLKSAIKNIQDIKIKWPNDVYVADKKIAGILIENFLLGDKNNYSVIGIGVNINQKKFLSDAPNPVSLTNITGEVYDTDEVLTNLRNSIEMRYEQLRNGQFTEIDSDYLNILFRFGKFFPYEINNKKMQAKIIGINLFGKLILETEAGDKIECDLHEVVWII
jgi:BirA family biotin operon repressor/biotin-[acetyl-CoA-carboxylase] ligase